MGMIKVTATQLGRLPLLSTGRLCSFTYEGVRYTGRLLAKDVPSMSDVWEMEGHGVVHIPWGSPDDVEKRFVDCEVQEV